MTINSRAPASRLLFLLCASLCLVSRALLAGGDKVTITYWEKWTGFEADAMRAVVDDFNAAQDRIFVEMSTVSQIDRRLVLATAGGVPPDVAGIWAEQLPVYAENNALTPLDRMASAAGITGDEYIPAFWNLCRHRGHLWALPSTPTSIGLIYNKKMFREAGLDPERPPRTIAELEEFNGRLLHRSDSGKILTIGHLPEEPGWWSPMWGYWFGGSLWDGKARITADSPENRAAFRWIQSYPDRFGAANLLAMHEGFSNFASSQNAFFTGRVAMVLQGVWIYNFIEKYAPADFEWGVAPFPTAIAGDPNPTTIVECDILVIPHGAKHPREAFEFIRYVNSRKPMEKLCLGQRKFSPLIECSEEFFEKHPNPFIRAFLELAKSPNARTAPRMATWTEYAAELKNAVGRVWAGKADAEKALAEVQIRQQKSFDRQRDRRRRLENNCNREWDKP